MTKKELKRVVTADKTVKAAGFKSSRSRRREGGIGVGKVGTRHRKNLRWWV